MEEYIQILDSSDIDRCVDNIAEKINALLNGKEVVLCSILKGAVYFAVDLSRKLQFDHTLYFIEAHAYDGQKQKDMELLTKISPNEFENKHVLLVDELFDNGTTLYSVKQLLLNHDELNLTEDDITTCVAFRKKKKVKYPKPDIIGCDNMPDVWFVGYGLDSNGFKRNLKELRAVPKAPGIPRSDDDRMFSYPYKSEYYKQLLYYQIISTIFTT